MKYSPSPIAFEEIETLQDYILGETDSEIALNNSADHRTITDHLAQQATRSMRIFTRDLDPAILDRVDFIDACKRLALRSRYARIEILAFNSASIIRRGHRLIELARALSSRIEIRRPEQQYQKHIQAFITFDEKGYIYRTYADRFEGIANYNNARATRQHEKLFKEIWARSHVDSEMRSLHI